ncbi:hypothetical protein EXIGLDRAFT_718883 [Exidia glandulosa HHB12029]|uniref:Uncharacterized protein n=1 Tax=Exidia glandulosa HHB12029 TaxID=1314781 RepID=A0A165HEK3_EXIGL|nr:hypothetical protein EXIGLDRAFT_718883 [Exidia glandulosa HHB12029]
MFALFSMLSRPLPSPIVSLSSVQSSSIYRAYLPRTYILLLYDPAPPLRCVCMIIVSRLSLPPPASPPCKSCALPAPYLSL